MNADYTFELVLIPNLNKSEDKKTRNNRSYILKPYEYKIQMLIQNMSGFNDLLLNQIQAQYIWEPDFKKFNLDAKPKKIE